MTKEEGIMLSTNAAATVAVLDIIKEKNIVDKKDKTILYGTESGLATPNE